MQKETQSNSPPLPESALIPARASLSHFSNMVVFCKLRHLGIQIKCKIDISNQIMGSKIVLPSLKISSAHPERNVCPSLKVANTNQHSQPREQGEEKDSHGRVEDGREEPFLLTVVERQKGVIWRRPCLHFQSSAEKLYQKVAKVDCAALTFLRFYAAQGDF